jgi:predicted nuclease of predicted toxin-antitoxin system
VRFLLDNNLSPIVADMLKAAGHDAVHVRDLGMQAAPDEVVLECARVEERVLISADTDFGGLLFRSKASTPSVILIRRLVGRRAAEQSAIILANLSQVAEDLAVGAVVVIHEDLLRVRRLPI